MKNTGNALLVLQKLTHFFALLQKKKKCVVLFPNMPGKQAIHADLACMARNQ